MKRVIITFLHPYTFDAKTGKSVILKLGQGEDGKDGADGKDASVTNKPYSLSAAGWVYEAGYYKYTITDPEIVDGAYVPVTLANDTLAVAVDADIQPSPEFGEGFMKIFAINRPNGDINVNYTVIT